MNNDVDKTTVEPWEDNSLGYDETKVKVAEGVDQSKIDDAFGLQMISIRLKKELIENFKTIASVRGLGYQPLMKQALERFANSELKLIAIEMADLKNKENKDGLVDYGARDCA